MTPFLENVKLFLRVDGTDNDDIINDLIEYAMAYVQRTTGQTVDLVDPLNRMAIKLLVRHWFDGNDEDVPYGINSILTQIKYSPTIG